MAEASNGSAVVYGMSQDKNTPGWCLRVSYSTQVNVKTITTYVWPPGLIRPPQWQHVIHLIALSAILNSPLRISPRYLYRPLVSLSPALSYKSGELNVSANWTVWLQPGTVCVVACLAVFPVEALHFSNVVFVYTLCSVCWTQVNSVSLHGFCDCSRNLWDSTQTVSQVVQWVRISFSCTDLGSSGQALYIIYVCGRKYGCICFYFLVEHFSCNNNLYVWWKYGKYILTVEGCISHTRYLCAVPWRNE